MTIKTLDTPDVASHPEMSAPIPPPSANVDQDVWTLAHPAERAAFTRSVFFGEPDECWIWLGGIEPRGGYGRWRPPGGQVISAHRWSYAAHYGEPTDPVVRHTCDVRCCVNPHMLLAGTQAQNIRDTIERGAWRPIALPIWPRRSYQLRRAAEAGDRATVNEITARCEQLALFTIRRLSRD